MRFRNFFLVITIFILILTNTHGQVMGWPKVEKKINIYLLKNDKEERSLLINPKKKKMILEKYDQQKRDLLTEIFYQSVIEAKENRQEKTACDLGFIDNFLSKVVTSGLEFNSQSIEEYFDLLRSVNSIDDIFLRLLRRLNEVKFNLITYTNYHFYPKAKESAESDLFKKNDLNKLYKNFKIWPDGSSKCVIDEWRKLVKSVNTFSGKNLKKDLKKLNAKAYSTSIIDIETYRRLEYLRRSEVLNYKLYLNDYLNRVLKTKNVMKPQNRRVYNLPVEENMTFAARKSNLFRKVSLRESLYEKYSEDQIVVLAGVLRKASLRMGVDPDVQSSIPVISQTFSYENERGEYVTETDEYILDNAVDQYNYARKRMRIDLIKINAYESFNNMQVTYLDVVLAALETGYISHEEVELVLLYDDLWNKEQSKLMQALHFTWGVGNMAVFYLPPPYNVLGGIGVALINAQVINNKKGEDHDNPTALFN